jgi:hypothetical protein
MPGLGETLTRLVYKLHAPEIIATLLHQKIINKQKGKKELNHYLCTFIGR